MSDFIVKPVFSHGGGGILAKKPGDYTIKGPDGNVLEVVHVGGKFNEGNYKAQSKAIANGLPAGSTIEFGGTSYKLPQAGARYDFNYGSATGAASSKGALGSAPGGGTDGVTTPAGGFGAVPANLEGQFPNPVQSVYTDILPAPYKETSVKAFATQIGDFNREQIGKNTDLAKTTALDTIDTELQGLLKFVPGAANLGREEVAKDNLVNQANRTTQIDSLLPNARGDLEAQRVRANTYASGKAPDSITDAALELGVRSSAADSAAAGGFGANSGAAHKLSDLQSADKRLQLAKYGEGLSSSNRTEAANLLLAPLEQNNFGSQVRVTPTESAGAIQQSEESRLDTRTVLDPGQALNTQISQQQYITSLEAHRLEFNASNNLNNDQFNTTNVNNFALSKFNYKVGYAQAVANAQQININTNVGLQQQQAAKDAAANETASSNANAAAVAKTTADAKKKQEEAANHAANVAAGTAVAGPIGGIIAGFF